MIRKELKEKCQTERRVYDEEGKKKKNEAKGRREQEKEKKRKKEGTKKGYELSSIRY
jgi:hypothetical protein